MPRRMVLGIAAANGGEAFALRPAGYCAADLFIQDSWQRGMGAAQHAEVQDGQSPGCAW